jgi:Holliday junction DNA helicase RuvA
MIAHVQGRVSFRSPAYIVLDCNGVGYGIQISLHTYDKIGDAAEIKLLTHLAIKEDGHTLYGFADEEERQLFLQLISVSGVGPNTARMILSSMKTQEVQQAILSGNWAQLKSVKGIGPKTAQRIVIDLQDKIRKTEQGTGLSLMSAPGAAFDEALSALVTLGFSKNEAEKALMKVKNENPGISVEQLIKNALKIL